MTTVTRLTTPPVSAYAPGAISEITVAAVDKIGDATSEQIRHTAATIRADAEKIAGTLDQLAAAFDEHTRIASEKVSEFCLKMASARNMVRSLEGQISGDLATADDEPSPAFLHNTDAAGRRRTQD